MKNARKSEEEIPQKINGHAWVLGDNIDTDLIVPSHVLTEQSREKLLGATLEEIIPEFAQRVQPGDVILAGRNFGCGSSREEAVFVLQQLGISAIVARSFARIFYRNCINLGLIPIVLDDAPIVGEEGDLIVLDIRNGRLFNETKEIKRHFSPFPPFIGALLHLS